MAVSAAMGSTSYAVELTIDGTPDFSSSSGWGYIAVVSKTTTGFTIDLRTSAGGAFTVPTGQTLSIDWVAILNG